MNVLHGKICSFSYGFETSSYKHLIVCISVWSQCLWLATRQRQINNLDFRINHIVQDSEVFPQHVINHPNSTRHCVDWLLIRTDRVTGDYSAPSRAAVCPLSISVRKRQKRWKKIHVGTYLGMNLIFELTEQKENRAPARCVSPKPWCVRRLTCG